MAAAVASLSYLPDTRLKSGHSNSSHFASKPITAPHQITRHPMGCLSHLFQPVSRTHPAEASAFSASPWIISGSVNGSSELPLWPFSLSPYQPRPETTQPAPSHSSGHPHPTQARPANTQPTDAAPRFLIPQISWGECARRAQRGKAPRNTRHKTAPPRVEDLAPHIATKACIRRAFGYRRHHMI